jgi:prepilin-type N-terminal cleavage/methylation domain-containing protein
MSLNKKNGFTLIEIMAVIFIIAVLSTIVLANVSSARKNARDAVRQRDIREIGEALDLYAISNGGGTPPSAINLLSSLDEAGWEVFLTELGLVPRKDPLNGQFIDGVTIGLVPAYLQSFSYIFVKTVSGQPISPVICARIESADPDSVPICAGGQEEGMGEFEPFTAINNNPPLGCKMFFNGVDISVVYGGAPYVCIQTGYKKR